VAGKGVSGIFLAPSRESQKMTPRRREQRDVAEISSRVVEEMDLIDCKGVDPFRDGKEFAVV
jgi:hypothetical protein